MKPTDEIEKSIRQLQDRTGAELDARTLTDACQVLAKKQQTQSASNKPNIWRTIMKSKMTKLAVAAAIIIAGLIGINHFGGSIDGTNLSFAAVLDNISNARNVVYTETSEIPDYTFTNVKMVNENGIIRCELEHGTVMIFDLDNGYTLDLMTNSKQAIRTHRTGRKKSAKGFSYIGWVRKLHEGEAEFVGREELEGEAVNVYVWEVPFEEITVWVDAQSNLPVKVEHKCFANTEKNVVMPELGLSMGDFGGDSSVSRVNVISSGRGSGLGISEDRTRTMYDFQWDAELDDALFSLEPPEGYTLEERQREDSPMDENSLVDTLGFWAQMCDGEFPTEEDINDPQAFKPLLIEKYDSDGDPKEEFDAAMGELNKILRGIYVVQVKKVGGSWGYNGEDIRLGDAQGIVCWWKDEGSDSWTVIYGDLSIGEVAEEELPIGY